MKEAYSPTPWTFFGFGGTPPDAKKFVEPYKCVAEVERVLKRIMDRHGIDRHDQKDAPAVLGWSQGALIAQLVAKSIRPSISRGILAGSIYNPRVTSPPETIYYRVKSDIETIKNHNEVAEKVFHYPRDKTAQQFAEAAMISDPHTAIWRHMSQFNDVDPQRVHLPTLIITGEQDSYSPVQAQIDLYSNLCRGADRMLCILADADHAAHLLDSRERALQMLCRILFSVAQKVSV
jgi:pimeloyl-ACP methyl ester carboxylesterase